MDKDTAWTVICASLKAARELQDLLPLARERLATDASLELMRGVAQASDAINASRIDKALAAHPALEARIEAELSARGRLA